MVTLYVAGQKVGTLDDAPKLIPEFIARNQRVEFRDENGNSIATLNPTPPLDPNEPLVPWDPTITREEIERRMAGEFLTFDEVKRRLGWE